VIVEQAIIETPAGSRWPLAGLLTM